MTEPNGLSSCPHESKGFLSMRPTEPGKFVGRDGRRTGEANNNEGKTDEQEQSHNNPGEPFQQTDQMSHGVVNSGSR